MSVARWGNRLIARLAAAVVEVLGLEGEGDSAIPVTRDRRFAIGLKPSRDALIQRLRPFRGRLPADFRFDRDEANGR